jgi:hypothetical protein
MRESSFDIAVMRAVNLCRALHLDPRIRGDDGRGLQVFARARMTLVARP